MIIGLFEAHIMVSSLEVSINFYKNLLGLIQGHIDNDRRTAFFWVGKPGTAMLGLWETCSRQIRPQHYAFHSTVEFISQNAEQYFQDRGLPHYNFLGEGRGECMVFAWMPAVSIYFRDPDNHELEFIAMLPGLPRPELGVVSYSQWQQQGLDTPK